MKRFEIVLDGQVQLPYDDFGFHDGLQHEAERIARIIRENGYECTTSQAYQLWCIHSASRCAGWLHTDNQSHEVLFHLVKKYIRDT